MTDPRAKIVPTAWAGVIDRWCLALAASGASEQTRVTRRAHVSKLARAMPCAPQVIDAGELVAWLGRQRWAAETRRAWRASLRSFFAFLDMPDVVDAIPRARAAIPTPRPAPDRVVAVGFRSADERTTLILRLAAEAGLRRGEIARVHANDLTEDLGGWSLLVHGKGGRSRLMPLSDELATLVRRRARDGWAFPGQIDGHLSARRVGELAADVLPDGWTLHTLRHRFATRAHVATSDLIAVQRLLGHASVATTQRYVATDAARLRSVALAAA